MPPNGDNDVINFDRGTGEEAKMCKKDDTANSPATGGVSTYLPVSTMSTPLDPGTQMDENAKNFLNALTGQTGVPYKVISFEDERGFDEQLKPQLRANQKQVQEKNRDWWRRLGLDNFRPLGEIDPFETPNAYANLTFTLQRFFNNTGTSKEVFKRTIDEDGIFGREPMLVLFKLAEQYPSNEKKLSSIPQLLTLVQDLSGNVRNLEANKETFLLVYDLQQYLATVLTKPDPIVTWNYEITISALADFYRYNAKKKGPLRQGLDLERSFYPLIRELCQNDQEAEHIADVLSLEQKLDMLAVLYGEQHINVSAVYFEVKRWFTHNEDLAALNPNKHYKEGLMSFMFPNANEVDEAEPVLKIQFPNWGLVTKTRERSKNFGELPEEERDKEKNKDKDKDKKTEPLLISLALYHFLPKINPKQKAAAKALIDQYVLETDSENQAALDFIKQVQADVERRKTLPADITDYTVLMDVLTYRVASKGSPTAGVLVLMERAETTYFLTVKLDEKAEIFILTYRQIIDSNDKAIYYDSYPMKIGEFKPPPKSAVHLDDSNLKAAREGEYVRVKLRGLYQPWPERLLPSFTPVRVDIGVLDPGVGIVREFIRDTFTERVWQVTTQWFLSDSLPEVFPKIREQLDDGLWWKGLDTVITAGTLAFSFAGAFLGATGTTFFGGIGARAIVPLTKGLLKLAFWFVLTEYLVAKMMDFDQKINSDKEGYSDDDRALWNTFKIGLLVLGGAMVMRQAWKGLKFAGSKLFASTLTELELELLKKATMKPLPAAATMTRMLSAKTALTVSKQWAKEVLALTANTLRDLTEEAVMRLKQLPPWALNFIKEMKDEVIRKLFGCASFCKVDLTAIKNGLIEVIVNKLKIDKIKGILAAEREMLKNLSFEAWDRIIKYAVRNRNYFSVKGKIAEELFSNTPTFRRVYNNAIKTAEKLGIEAKDMEFVTYVRGWAPFRNPKALKAVVDGEQQFLKGVWAELTDGAIVGIKKTNGKEELHVLAVFESKSPSNMERLAVGKWGDNAGQIQWNFERIRENPVKIIINGEEKIFQPENIVVSSSNTKWVGVIPPSYKMSDAALTKLKDAMKSFEVMEGPVRNEVLNDLAEALKGIINYQPKKVVPKP